MISNTNFAYKDDELELVHPAGSFNQEVESIRIKDKSIAIKFKPLTEKKDIEVEIVNDWNELKRKFKVKLSANGITDNEFHDSFFKTLNKNHDKIIARIGNADKKEKEDTKPVKTIKTYKITHNGKLYESIIIGGISQFITCGNGIMELFDSIEANDDTIIEPMHIDGYPYTPYIFENTEEIQKYVNHIKEKKVTLDDIFNRIRREISNFIVQHDYVLDYITALIIFSYYQDNFATVPYTMFVSDNGNGKSAIGNFFETMAYRTVNMTDPTSANIFRVFGTLEAGQCTLVLDEADKIDKDSTMMSILKTGYENGKKVQRINRLEKQEHFNTFGVKIMLSERTPSPSYAKGVLDRTFIISNFKGKPNLDIKEVNSIRTQRNVEIKKFLLGIRKILLIFRVVNHGKFIVDIETGLEGRNKEICKPLLQIFYKTKVQTILENTLEILLRDKQKRKENSLEKVLLEIVFSLLDEYKDGNIPFYEIWGLLTEKIKGELSPFKSHEYDTEAYGTIYRQTVTKILRNQFGAKDSDKRSSTVTFLYFEDKERIKHFLDDYIQPPSKIICTDKVDECNECNEYNIEKLIQEFSDSNANK